MFQMPTSHSDARDLRVGEILNDYLDRRKLGKTESQAELLASHPAIADDLRDNLVKWCSAKFAQLGRLTT